MTELPKWKVVMCGECGWIQVCQAMKFLTCKKCGKKQALRKRHSWSLKVIVCSSAIEAKNVCLRWKEKFFRENQGEDTPYLKIRSFIK